MPQSIALHHYAGRLQRLLALINEIKTTSHQAPEALYTSLGISRPMFYKDRQVLKALGLAFHYDRQQRRYITTQDRYLPVLDLSTSEMLALIMAVRRATPAGGMASRTVASTARSTRRPPRVRAVGQSPGARGVPSPLRPTSSSIPMTWPTPARGPDPRGHIAVAGFRGARGRDGPWAGGHRRRHHVGDGSSEAWGSWLHASLGALWLTSMSSWARSA